MAWAADCPALPRRLMLLVVYMSFISAAAYSLWGVLLKHNPVSRITVFGFTTQIFGVLFSALFLREGSSFGWLSLGSAGTGCRRGLF